MTSPTIPPSPSTSSQPITAPGLRVKSSLPPQPNPIPAPDDQPGAAATDPVDSTRSPAGAETTAIPVSGKTISKFLRDALEAIGELAHDRFAASPEAQEAGLWLAGPEDQAQIADPLAAVAANHGIKTLGGPDTAQLIAAGIGLAAYLGRNLFAAVSIRFGRARLRRAELRGATAGPQQ